jgi:hypothetical protein
MSDITEEFNAMSFLRERVALTWTLADHFAGVCFWMAYLKFHVLSFGRRSDKLALYFETSANSSFRNLSKVGNRTVDNDLESAGATAVS